LALVLLISIVACILSYLVACGVGWDLRRDIRAKAPVLESVVFPVSGWTIMYFPFFSLRNVWVQSERMSKLRPEFAEQFRKFRIAGYSWAASLVSVVLSAILCAYGS